MVIQLKVQSPEGKDTIIDLCDNEEQMKKITVQQLKQIINKTLMMTDDNLQLVYGTKFLEDGALLVSYKITHMSNIQAVLQLPGGI